MAIINSSEYYSYPGFVFGSEGVGQNEATFFNQVTKMDRVREGTEMPDWRRRVAEGTNATTVLKASLQTCKSSQGLWRGTENGTIKHSSSKQGINVMIYNVGNPAYDIAGITKSKATSKAYKVINKLFSQFSGQVFLGEFGQTKKLLLHPLRQSVALAKALVENRNLAKNVAKSWLEFQFGIKPLLNDVDEIMKRINKTLPRVENLTYRTYDTDSTSLSSSVTEGRDIYGFLQRIDTIDSFKAECIVRFGVTQSLLDSANVYRSDWSSSFTDLSQIPVTAWELLPWSFLADYFVNVSEIIQAATTSTRNISYVSRSQIMTRSRRETGSTVGVLGAQYKITVNIPRVVTTTKRDVIRDAGPLGIPSVVFSLPGTNIRYLNIAALVTSFFTSRRS